MRALLRVLSQPTLKPLRNSYENALEAVKVPIMGKQIETQRKPL